MRKLVNSILAIVITLLTVLMVKYSIAPSTSLTISCIVVVLYVIVAAFFSRKGMYILLGLYITALIVFFKSFLHDTYYFLNEVAVTIANEHFIFLQQFDETSKYDGGFFISSVAVMICCITWKALQQSNRTTIVGLIIMPVLLQIILTTSVPFLISSCFFMTLFFTIVYMNQTLQHKSSLYVLSVMAFIFFSTTILLQMLNIKEDFIQELVQTKISEWRYNDQNTNLPNGYLITAKQLHQSDETVLNVVMEKPAPMYLKGFIGAQFTDYRWQHLDGERYLENMPLLSALKENGFSSYNQFSLAANELENEVLPYKMSVQNVGADRRYGYTPYETTAIGENLHDLDGVGVTAKQWLGAKSYEVTYSPTMIQQYPKIAGELYAQNENRYLNLESYYNEFVYMNYLQITTEDRALLNNHFAIDKPATSYEQAIEHVKESLQQKLQYTHKPSSESTSLSGLLEESKSGYSPHYATLATLLFRSLQIPARYVEGYIITTEDVEEKRDYSELKVAANNAHAWTEIYIDTIGWVPIEVTPGYEEKMPVVQTKDYPALEGFMSNQKTESAEGMTQAQQVKDEKITDEKNVSEVVKNNQVYVVTILCLLLLIVGLILLYKKLKHRRYLEAGNLNTKAIRYYSLMLYMLNREMRLTISNPLVILQWTEDVTLQQVMEQATNIYEKAKYSNEKISKSEFASVKQTTKTVKKAIRKTKKHIFKIPMLWRY